MPALALAATIVLLVGSQWNSLRETTGPWRIEPIHGAPTVGAAPVRDGLGLRADQWLETNATSSARLVADEVGEVEIGPRTRIRVVTTRHGEHRLDLAQGILHAYIWAAPGQFHVQTPSATAVDLGCAYSLEVDSRGDGVLRVTAGWVGFELRGRESRVPAGALCATRPGRGPGTPHFEDASPGLVDALAQLDEESGAASDALDVVLADARPRDALTLWHLLSRVDRSLVGRVFDRLAVFAPPPAGVRREEILAGNRAALDAWWDTLGLGDATRFRTWRLRSE